MIDGEAGDAEEQHDKHAQHREVDVERAGKMEELAVDGMHGERRGAGAAAGQTGDRGGLTSMRFPAKAAG